MPLRITGKNVDIGQALREHITTRTAEELGKYYDEPFTGHVVVQKEGKAYIVDCSIQLASGTTLQSRGGISRSIRRPRRRWSESASGCGATSAS